MGQLLAALGLLALLVALMYMGSFGHKPGTVEAPAQAQEIQRAKEVERITLEAAEAQRKQIEQQTRESKEDQINGQAGMAP